MRLSAVAAVAVVLVGAALALPASLRADAAPRSFKVVVHRDNPVQSLTRDQAARLFLKKATEWEAGQKVEPVDQLEASPVRAAFTEAVLRRTVTAVKAYWTQAIFSGREVPPPELDGDEAVMSYVARNAWAVGYVSAGATPSGVKVIPVGG